jgi:hypothetical protein
MPRTSWSLAAAGKELPCTKRVPASKDVVALVDAIVAIAQRNNGTASEVRPPGTRLLNRDKRFRMTPPDTAAWWTEVQRLIAAGDYAHADLLISDAERAVNAAKALIRPRAVSPAKARLQRFVAAKPTEAKR